MKNYRIDISGQFNLGNPWEAFCTKSPTEPFEVQRDSYNNSSSGIPTNEQPSNYDAFCNEVDTTIQQLVPVKKLHKFSGAFVCLWIVIAIIPQFYFRMLDYSNNSYLFAIGGYMAVVVLFSAVHIILFCKIWSSLRGVFLVDVGQICRNYSIPDVVTYQVKDEWWGGCSKASVRRYYLLVHVSNSSAGGDNIGGYDVEQQQGGMVQAQTGATVVGESFQTNPPPETAPSASASAPTNTTGGGTSLFDQLSGTKY